MSESDSSANLNDSRIPSALQIGPCIYTVKQKDDVRGEQNQPLYGHCQYTEQQITLWNGMHSQHLPVALMHEALHAVDHINRLDLSEKTVHRLAFALVDLLVRNQDLTALFVTSDEND